MNTIKQLSFLLLLGAVVFFVDTTTGSEYRKKMAELKKAQLKKQRETKQLVKEQQQRLQELKKQQKTVQTQQPGQQSVKKQEEQPSSEARPEEKSSTILKLKQSELTRKAQLARCLRRGVMGCFAFFRELQGINKIAAYQLSPIIVSLLLSRFINRGDVAAAASMFLLFGAKGGLRHLLSLPVKIGTQKVLAGGASLGRWGWNVSRLGLLTKKLGSLAQKAPIPGIAKQLGSGVQQTTKKLANFVLNLSTNSVVSSVYYSALQKIPGYGRLSRFLKPEPGEDISSAEYRQALEDILGEEAIEELPESIKAFLAPKTQKESLEASPKKDEDIP